MEKRYCLGCLAELEGDETVCPHCGYVEGTPPKEAYHMSPGTILKARYLVGRVLGFGGFGVTYIGMDLVLEQKVAIKEYLPTDFSTRMPGQAQLTVYTGENEGQFSAGLTRFLDEARRLARFNDVPGVVQIKDTFSENNTAYIVMEFLDGENVKEILKEEGKLPYDRALEITVAVLSTLTEVHKEGIIHRDISPDNIFVTNDGQIKLLDFGAARYATTYHSKSLSVILKPGYAPEEQYRSRGNQGPWSDVYATAATMYRMLTGVTPEEALERLAKDEVKEPSKLGVEIGENAGNALMNALNIKAEDRYQSAQEFIDALLSADPVLRNKIKQKKQDAGKWPLWLKLTAAAAALLAAVFPVLIYTGMLDADPRNWFTSLPDGMVNVPGVINDDIQTASSTVAEKNLVFKIVDKQYSEKTKADTVMLQDPQPGRLAAFGDQISVTVSAGPEQVYVPDVLLFTEEAAKAALDEAGLLVKTTEEENKDYAAGTVIAQSLEADSVQKKNTLIELTVATGADVGEEQVEIPNLVGMTFEEAQKALRELGLFAAKGAYAYSAGQPDNVVLVQSVPAGKTALKGSVVALTVNKGDAMIWVPDVQYKSEDEAAATMAAVGLKVKITRQKSDLVARGLVISQSVQPATQTKVGSEITLVVSLGNDKTVPDVTGRSEAEARQTLETAGFIFYASEKYSETVEKGIVVTQTPAGGAEAAQNSAVTVIISKGKDPRAQKVEVPNLIGQARADAQAALLRLELVPVFAEEYSDTVSAGLVCKQEPAGGELVKGGNVRLVISRGSEFIEMPSMVGASSADARSALTAAGFSVSESTQYSDTVAKGMVISQNPAGGKQKRGAAVAIVTSLGSDKVDVPNLAGQDEASALGTLASLGLRGSSSWEHSETQPRGTVIRQSAVGKVQMGSAVTVVISRGTADSGWLDGDGGNIDSNQYNVEKRTMYRVQKMEYTTNSAASLDGWERYGEGTTMGPEQESWYPVEQKEGRVIREEKRVDYSRPTNQYSYSRWTVYADGAQHTGPTAGSLSYWGGNPTYETLGPLSSPLARTSNSSTGDPRWDAGGGQWWYNENVETVHPIISVWYYSDPVYTYRRWGAWSAWSTTPAAPDGNTRVETKTQYHYSGK